MSTPSTDEKHDQLVASVHEGRRTIPEDIAPLVCKPEKIESWRIFKIMSEFVEGFDVIRRYHLAASFFGSARTSADDPYYQQADKLAGKLAKRGFAVITGGSAGIMQAANEGAYNVGGASIGLNISLPNEQGYNNYLTDKFQFSHFFVRKVMLTYASEVYIYFPGGFGTLDEFFEIVTLVQTKKINPIPIVVYGKEYWEPIMELVRSLLLEKFHTVSKEDLDIIKVVDSVDEAYEYITSSVKGCALA